MVRAAAAEEARAGRNMEEAAQLVKAAERMRDRMSADACTLPDKLNGRLDFQVLLAMELPSSRGNQEDCQEE